MLHINANQSHSQHYSIDDSDLIDYYVFFYVISQIHILLISKQNKIRYS